MGVGTLVIALLGGRQGKHFRDRESKKAHCLSFSFTHIPLYFPSLSAYA